MATTKAQPKIDRLLETARKNKELSKAAASRELGVTRMTYDMWERGAWVPAMENIDVLAAFTGLRKEEIFSILARANGFIDKDAYLEIHYGK